MKFFLFVFSIALSSVAFADDCPNISGEFLSGEKELLKIEQSSCSTVSFRFGKINHMGMKKYKPGYLEYNIGGDPLCRMPNNELCTTVVVRDDLINFETDYNGAVDGGIHGVCAYRTVSRKLDSNMNLVNIYDAYDCADGSSVQVEKIFLKTVD
jgi:hypothetical protein